MRYAIELRGDHLHAVLVGRESAADMRAFVLAVHAACGSHRCPRILMFIRESRPVFRAEDYGINGYAHELATPACQVALVGDNAELHAAHEYIEICARQENLNVRAFADEIAALRWLRGAPQPERRYRFTRIVVQGAPQAQGVYALWDGEEIVYYGRTSPGTTLRSQLAERLGRVRATHYGWEVCADPGAREAELLAEHRRAHGRLPRDNAAS